MNNFRKFKYSILKKLFIIQVCVVLIGSIGIYVSFHLSSQRLANKDLENEKIRLSRSIESHLDQWTAWFALGMNEPLNEELIRFKRDHNLKAIEFIDSKDIKNTSKEDLFFKTISHDFNSKNVLWVKFKGKDFSDIISTQKNIIYVISVLFIIFSAVSYFSLLFLRNNIHAPLMSLITRMQKESAGENLPVTEIKAHGEMRVFVEELVSLNMRMKEMERTSAVGIVAAQVSHDMMSPMASLEVLLENTVIPPEEKELLSLTVDRIKEISSNLRMKTNVEIIKSCNPIIEFEKIMKMKILEPKFSKISFQYNKENDLESETASIPPSEISRIFSNIINNAADSYNEGIGQVEVSFKRIVGFLEIQISDNGCGMSDEVLSKIGKFGVTFKSEGSGIGLHHAISVVENAGGKIVINSIEGKGTKIKIILPLV